MKKLLLVAFAAFGVAAMSGCKKDDHQPVVPDPADTIVTPPADTTGMPETVSLTGTLWECNMDVEYSASMIVHSDIQLNFLSDSTALYQEHFSSSHGQDYTEFDIIYTFDGKEGGTMVYMRNGAPAGSEVVFTYNDETKVLVIIEPGNLTPEEHQKFDKVFHIVDID